MPQDPQIAPLRGFDRLISAGFTEDDIATIRRQFRSSRGLDHDAGPLEEEDRTLELARVALSRFVGLIVIPSVEDEHARALEEQWIDSLDGAAGTVDPSLDSSECIQIPVPLHGVVTPPSFQRSRWPVHDPSPRSSHWILFWSYTVLLFPIQAPTSCVLLRCVRATPSSR